MSKINYDLINKAQQRAKFKQKNEDKINKYFLAYCESYTQPVQNLAQFTRDIKAQIFEDLWADHLKRSANSKASREKKKRENNQVQQQHPTQP
ncbi:hypothetical protein [Lactobacillus gallinarum]|uniref:hypothetical protein n=1 Tax=Lactobacillus gallinarum TaxID=52242 RepID=UPI00195EFD00|nr:hypothetical protein [Lactobacillus gallinarum]MBM6973845.1 hypothetical protein [Lactobacillus gallinarum]